MTKDQAIEFQEKLCHEAKLRVDQALFKLQSALTCQKYYKVNNICLEIIQANDALVAGDYFLRMLKEIE